MIYYCETSAEKLQKGSEIKAERRERQHHMAYALLAYGMKKEYGIKTLPEVCRDKYGKPYFADFPEIHFNLSHCDAGVLCAISDEKIGVDIECRFPYRKALAKRISHERELGIMECADETERERLLQRLWTVKESYLKYTGLGIRVEMNELCFDGWVKDEFMALGCHFKMMDGENCQICICSPRPIGSCVLVEPSELENL